MIWNKSNGPQLLRYNCKRSAIKAFPKGQRPKGKPKFCFCTVTQIKREREKLKEDEKSLRKGPNLTLLNSRSLSWFGFVLKLGLVEILGRERFEFGARELFCLSGSFSLLVFLWRGGWGSQCKLRRLWRDCWVFVEANEKEWAPCRGLALKMSCSPPLLLAILTVLSLFLCSLSVCSPVWRLDLKPNANGLLNDLLITLGFVCFSEI